MNLTSTAKLRASLAIMQDQSTMTVTLLVKHEPVEELVEIDCDIGKAIKNSAVWCKTAALLKSVPGIGDVTARTLLAEVPELRDSGLMRGHRPIAGGRTS